MIEKRDFDEAAVDRREETLTIRKPGYIATEQIVQDVAEERRIELFQIFRIMWTILVFLEILMSFRFLLRLIGANPDTGFAMFIYGLTGLFVGPFNGMIITPPNIELTTLIAMIIYALVFWGIAYLIRLITDRPGARSILVTTREQPSGTDGVIRTTHTTISNGKY